MDTVMTVRGPLPADQLGFTLIHEHIFLDLMRDVWSGEGFLNDPELAAEEINAFKEAGGATVVDQTSGGLRGNDQDLFPVKHAIQVRKLSEKTGVNIVLGSGWYRETYYEPSLWRKKTDEIAEDIYKELTQGIEGTDVRAGIIGEVGSHFTWISPVEERVLRAAARAQKRSGVLLTTHATRGPVGLDQLEILEQEGVDLSRVSIGHCHSYPHLEYSAEIARRGAFICFDRMGSLLNANDYERQKLLRLVGEVLDAGLVDHLLFSHDICYQSDLKAYGGCGYEFIPTRLLGILGELGVTEEQFHQIMVENPRRALTGRG